MTFHRPFTISPWRVIIFSIIFITIMGSLLLSLPAAQKTPHSFVDLFFTSSSAVCVTGILTVPLDSFSFLGKIIILFLIQVGGLGLLTLVIPLVSLFFNVRMRTHLITGHQFELENWSHNWIYSRHVITFILCFSLMIEAIGSITTYFLIGNEPLSDPRWFAALFHGISSFCNSGIAIFPGDMASVQSNGPLIALTSALMVIGGFGFVPLYEISIRLWNKFRGIPNHSRHLTLQSKIIIYFTPALTLIFAPLIWISEHIQFAGMTFWQTINMTLFNAISLRSCGFCTLDLSTMTDITLLLILVFAFIGSSPGSVGGGTGIKVTSFVLALASIRTAILGKEQVELFGRRIPVEQIFRAFAIIVVSLSWCIFSTLILMITESGSPHPFMHFLFEAISAFANHGVTLGLAPSMTGIGKYFFSVGMIFGRISSLTLILALKKHKEKSDIRYPEERILLV